jgi:non-canonical purine NTP pyrophosphatase (RdgB/HAM1 family)
MITFVTGNPHKAAQLEIHLGHPVAHVKLELDEIQSLSLEEVVEHKVREAYAQVGSPVLVEDTALVFHAKGRLPGPFIKWYLQELDNAGLCNELGEDDDRSATASVVFGYYDGQQVRMYRSDKNGHIAMMPMGERGFGWDPVFVPEDAPTTRDGIKKTWGMMNEDEQKQTSMRRHALKLLAKDIENEFR